MNYSDEILEDLIKETYAHFWLAYYLSECIHKELCHIQVSHFNYPKICYRKLLLL
jgi:hypothetical protein